VTKPPPELDSACLICHADSLTDRRLGTVEDFTRFAASSQTNSQPTTDIRDFWSILLTRMLIPRHQTEIVTRSPDMEDNSVVDR